MEDDEEQRKLREEIVAKWKKQYEHETSQRVTDLRFKDSNRIIITLDRPDWRWKNAFACSAACIGIGLVLCIKMGTIVVGIIVGIVGTLFGLLDAYIGESIVFDKSTETITVKRRPFLLISKKDIIPFSSVSPKVVTLERNYGPHGEEGGWVISLNYIDPGGRSKKLEFVIGGWDMHQLYAEQMVAEINNFIENGK